MKFKNNWKEKSLDMLEGTNSPRLNANDTSYLIYTCNNLRKKQLKLFEIEDLRIMIGQSIGLNYLVPLAIEVLKENILAEGHFYDGDLLNSVLTSDKVYWIENSSNWETICELFEQNKVLLNEFDTTWRIRKELFDNYTIFKKINQ